VTRLLVFVGLAVAIVAACALEPDVGPRIAGSCSDADTQPGTSVSFANQIRPLITRTTSGGVSGGGCSCHLPGSTGSPGAGTQLSGLDLSSMDNLRTGGLNSGSQIVVAGQPCRSIMYEKLSISPPFGSRMPLNGPPFWSADELRLLHDWIAEGANDN
jgi:hypothetical protein